MVAKITVPVTIKRALNYNEQKVKEGKAACIQAHHFLKEAKDLNFYEKLHRFEALIDLNKRAKTNTLHVSLNFALEEKLSGQKLKEIAAIYMDKIGFGKQPYLVYQHFDAGHPHLHIVTTNIQADGKRISMHNLGRNQSAEARKEIEKQFGLVKAESCQNLAVDEIKPVQAVRVIYGRSATKRAITNVLDAVLLSYKYSSLPELNAVLQAYNVVADRGKEGGAIYSSGGLVYRALDEQGNKIGVPIKASSIHSRPTLNYLQAQFIKNEALKAGEGKQLKNALNWVLRKPGLDLFAFKSALAKEKISLVTRQNDNGQVYGLTYVDHNTKAVFNGSDLGKEYSAKAILERYGKEQALLQINQKEEVERKDPRINRAHYTAPDKTTENSHLLGDLMKPEQHQGLMPYELRKGKKKKRKQ